MALVPAYAASRYGLYGEASLAPARSPLSRLPSMLLGARLLHSVKSQILLAESPNRSDISSDAKITSFLWFDDQAEYKFLFHSLHSCVS